MGILAGLGSMLGWGTADLLGAMSSRKIGNVVTLLWMLIIGCTIAFIYFLFTFSSYDLSKIPQNLLLLVLIGLLQTIAYLALYRALMDGKVGIVMPIIGAWALITVMLSIFILHEVLKNTQILAIILIMVGVPLLSLDLKEIIKERKNYLIKRSKSCSYWNVCFWLVILSGNPCNQRSRLVSSNSGLSFYSFRLAVYLYINYKESI